MDDADAESEEAEDYAADTHVDDLEKGVGVTSVIVAVVVLSKEEISTRRR